jgi:O-antigen/teichoic acid export membrane protein
MQLYRHYKVCTGASHAENHSRQSNNDFVNSPVKNFSILAVGETAAKVMGIVTTIYLARVLGVEGFGFVGFVTALCGYFSMFANPGFDTVGTREIARGQIPAPAIISSIFIIRFGLSVTAFGVLICVTFVSPFSDLVRTMVIIQGCNILLVPFMFQFFFRGTKDMLAVSYSRITQSCSYMALVFLLVSSEENLIRIPIIFVVSNLLALLPLNMRILREFPLRSFRIDRSTNKELGRHIFRVGAAAILVQIYISFDTILLGYMRSPQEVGVYTAAYKIITVLTIIPGLIFQAFLPELSTPSSEERSRMTMMRYQMILILSGALVGIVGMMLARFMLVGIFGESFESGIAAFQILLFTTMIIYFNVALANPLLAWGREKEYLLIVGAGACINIVLNISLIPRYGIIGAALATCAAETVVFFVSLLQRYRLSKVTSLQNTVRREYARPEQNDECLRL